TRDRYGRIPDSVEQLFGYAQLRLLAEELGVLAVDKTPDGVALKVSEKARISPQKLAAFVNARAGRVFSPTGVLKLSLNDDEFEQLLDTTRSTLREISD